jgi:glyoxylase-like metal-dependent hydrolase (beta-lactamase superfamily II)
MNSNTARAFLLVVSTTVSSVAPTASLRAQQALTVTPVNGTSMATILSGPRSAVLVDAQLSTADVTSLIEKVRATGKPLAAIYITHAHPDHALGLDGLRAAFPEAKLIASKATSDGIAAAYAGWRERFAARLAPQASTDPFKFEAPGKSFEVDGVRAEVIDGLHGDDANSMAVWIPSQKVLIAGDVLFNKVHLLLSAQRTPEDRAAWVASVDRLEKLGATTIVAGHVKAGLAMNGDAFAFTRTYIKDFYEAAAQAGAVPGLVAAMKAKYPDSDLDFLLSASAAAALAGR